MNEDVVDFWINKLQPHIDACENCEPHDDGEVVWISGESQSVAEYLYDNEVPEELHDAVANELTCRRCACALQLETEVVVDSFESQLDAEAGERFGWWVVEDNPRLNAFAAHLRQSPQQGRAHEVGEELFHQLTELRERPVSGDWWRARSFSESASPPTPSQLGPPPKPSDSRGRFSPIGQRVFYLGSTKSAAIEEARKYQNPGQHVWVQRFRISHIARVVTLAPQPFPSDPFRQADLPILVAGLMWCNGLVQQRKGEQQRAEYLLPQFIADCVAEIGMHGILFNSLLHGETNLVLFAWTEDTVAAIGEPEQST